MQIRKLVGSNSVPKLGMSNSLISLSGDLKIHR